MKPVEEAGLALAVGSLGAPALYVILGYVRPMGFVNFRGSDLSVPATYFLTAWVFSAALVLPIGALLWRTLHDRRVDGFLSYSAVAVITALILSLWAGSGPEATLGVASLAVANALLIRITELMLRKRTHDIGA